MEGENDSNLHNNKDSISAGIRNFEEDAPCIENLLDDANMSVYANRTEIPFEKKVIDDNSNESNETKTVSSLTLIKCAEKIHPNERKDLFLTKDTGTTVKTIVYNINYINDFEKCRCLLWTKGWK